ncbi:MAG: MFS transporter, partial [Hyphomicrobium sp.]
LQGLGAAIIFPLSLAMITLTFPKEQRGVALGIYAAVGTIFLALGPFVGGLLIDILSWRWIFWINPFIVIVIAMVVLAAWTEPVRDGTRESIDYWGLVSLVSGLSLLVLALMQGPEWGWSQPVIWVLLAAGIAGLASFVYIEHRIAAPLIAVNLFRGGTFSTSNLIIFTAQFNQMTIVVFGALYFQKVLHMSPLVAGAALLVGVGAAPIMATPTGRLADRIGARPVALGGLALTVAALVWIAIAVNFESYALLIPGLIAWGSANCALYIAPRRAALNSVPLSRQGETGGILMTSQLLGGTIGMAICGSLYAMTGDFRVVFMATAVLTIVVLAMTWLWLETESVAEAKA